MDSDNENHNLVTELTEDLDQQPEETTESFAEDNQNESLRQKSPESVIETDDNISQISTNNKHNETVTNVVVDTAEVAGKILGDSVYIIKDDTSNVIVDTSDILETVKESVLILKESETEVKTENSIIVEENSQEDNFGNGKPEIQIERNRTEIIVGDSHDAHVNEELNSDGEFVENQYKTEMTAETELDEHLETSFVTDVELNKSEMRSNIKSNNNAEESAVVNQSNHYYEVAEEIPGDDQQSNQSSKMGTPRREKSIVFDREMSAKKECRTELCRLPRFPEDKKPISALTPVYSFGFNRYVPIINLSDENKCFIFYSCSHFGIIYDYFHNEQLILQGHCNSISCTSASRDRRWLATGDEGAHDSVIIIWDASTGLPVRTMFEPHPNGVTALALSPCARYLATLSAEHSQTFAIWDWTTGNEAPLCSASLVSQYGIQNQICFCNEEARNVVTNSDTQVLFYEWDKVGNIKYFAPRLSDKDFNKQIGKFSNSLFLPNTTKALTATSQGLMVVWDGNVSIVKDYIYDDLAQIHQARFLVPNEMTADKKAIKLVPLHTKGISILTIIDSYIVTGDVSGYIKFFDFDFKLMFWFQDWNFGPITSISPTNYDNIRKIKFMLENSDYPNDATIANNKFVVRDFIVGTATTIFASVTVEGSTIKIIFHDHDSSVYSAHTHPTLSVVMFLVLLNHPPYSPNLASNNYYMLRPLVATGSYSGLFKIWNYETKTSIKSRLFDNQPIRSICFDHRGTLVALGFVNGSLHILDTHALRDVVTPFTYSRTHISMIRFSENSEFLVTVDGAYATTLYRHSVNSKTQPWVYVARYRAHYKQIVDVMFGRFFDTQAPRLFTLGEDRRLVEYDLVNASQDNLPILHDVRVEQSSIPLSMCWYPETEGEGFFVMANDDYKLKMYNHQTKMCRFTFLGPTFGSPIKILRRLPKCDDHPLLENGCRQRYLVYSNQNKIGIMRVPLNGNPYNYMTMIGHPRGVTSISPSFDGRYLISVGEDFIVSIWKIDVSILEARANSVTDDMTPYYEMMEGGEFGPFMNELKNYFYYSMIRMQGIDSLDTRKVNVVIDITEIPFIMRAIGFYPSEEEIEDMKNELKFKDFNKTGEMATKCDLDTFIKLYINHRPPFGIGSDRIDEAFRLIQKTTGGPIDINKFMNLIMNKGESVGEDELVEYLSTLLGFSRIGGGLENEEFMPAKVRKDVNDALPKIVDSHNFVEKILSMKVVDNSSLGITYRRHVDKVEEIDKSDNGSQTI